jgi:hypothetical protein
MGFKNLVALGNDRLTREKAQPCRAHHASRQRRQQRHDCADQNRELGVFLERCSLAGFMHLARPHKLLSDKWREPAVEG